MQITPRTATPMPNPWANKPKLSADLLQKTLQAIAPGKPRQDDALFSVLEPLPTHHKIDEVESGYMKGFGSASTLTEKYEWFSKMVDRQSQIVSGLEAAIAQGDTSYETRHQLGLEQEWLNELRDPDAEHGYTRDLKNFAVRMDLAVMPGGEYSQLFGPKGANGMYWEEFCGEQNAREVALFIDKVHSAFEASSGPGDKINGVADALYEAYRRFEPIKENIKKNFEALMWEMEHPKTPEEEAAEEKKEADAIVVADVKSKLERIEQRTTRSAAVLPQAGVTPWGRPAWAATPALYRGRFRARA